MFVLFAVGTTVFSNQYSVTHDEKMYKDAESFIPDRFIDSDGNYSKPETKHFVPFGIGKSLGLIIINSFLLFCFNVFKICKIFK